MDMKKEGIVHLIANTNKGIIAILEFSGDIIPFRGLSLEFISNKHKYNIIGQGMPLLFSDPKNKIKSKYHSKAIWECLIEPYESNEVHSPVKEGDIFVFEDKS